MDGRWMEAGATPLLESFHTKALPEACREVHDRDLPPAVKSQASRLVHLGTDYYGPPIELGCLSRLRTISFVPLYQDEPLTQSQWHALLSSAPLLSNIKIDATGLTDRDSTDVFTSPIDMPELRELIVIKPPLTLLHALLGAIVPAPKKYPLIKLPQYRRPYPRVTIYESQAFAGSILSKLQEMDRISTNISAGSRFHTYNGWHGNDKILMNEYTYISDLTELSVPSTGFQFLRSLEIPIINLHNERGVVHGIRLCLALENLVVLDDGHVSSHVSSALLNLCMSLAAPLLNQPASPQLWPCPNLRYLEFDLRYSWDHFQYIKNCIETRYGVRDMDTPSPPPVFLQELRLTKWQSQLDSLSRAGETADSVGAFKEVLHSHGTELSYEC
ncbi:hypothetical protein FRC02_004764 [Tulasnella sp. 418]|nr:hypothetical protein FRC02_004764 [Tulasnella sp. 418]